MTEPSRARLIDRGYRTYDGPRTGTRGAVQSVALHGLRAVLGLGRADVPGPGLGVSQDPEGDEPRLHRGDQLVVGLQVGHVVGLLGDVGHQLVDPLQQVIDRLAGVVHLQRLGSGSSHRVEPSPDHHLEVLVRLAIVVEDRLDLQGHRRLPCGEHHGGLGHPVVVIGHHVATDGHRDLQVGLGRHVGGDGHHNGAALLHDHHRR